MNILSAFVFVCLQSSSYGGISRTGNPLSWRTAKPVLNSVRQSGIKQFIYHYNRSKNIETPLFLWGDEIEYGLFGYDPKSNRFDLSLRGRQIREQLSLLERGLTDLKIGCEWQPEYGSWMIEAVPRDPYGGYISDLLLVEKNMQLRRKRLHAALNSNEIAPTTANFPMMGVEGYAHTVAKEGVVANSKYLADDVINPHPRFGTLTRNIRQRRQNNVNIQIPAAINNIEKLHAGVIEGSEVNRLFDCCDDGDISLRDVMKMENEKHKNDQVLIGSEEKVGEARERGIGSDVIHMDAMAFGMGCCCLQVTMQANDDRESRFVHDQLSLLAPIFLALSASTPIFRGKLAGTDTRWDVISQSVDDRTDSERGVVNAVTASLQPDPELVAGGKKRLFKSRYSSVSRFIGKTETEEEQRSLDALNDIDANIDEEAFAMLLEGGLDRSLAAHIAHLFVRDPLVIFDDAIVLDDKTAMDHFENIQSTNWRTMRWKSPSLEMGLEADRRSKVKQNAQQQQSSKQVESSSATASPASEPSASLGTKVVGGDVGSSVDAVDSKQDIDEKDIQSFGPGWRVEFRPLEIQLTDFENAAFSLLTVLTTRSLLAMGYNFYLPVSLMESNMERAQQENAVMTQKFWVRKEAFSPSLTTIPLTSANTKSAPVTVPGVNKFGTIKRKKAAGETEESACLVPKMSEITAIELTLDEFFNGRAGTAIDRAAGRQGEAFPGLIPAIYGYLEALGCNSLMIGRLRPYLTLLQKKASGELPTTAQWIRSFVRSHPEYKGDGTVTPGIANELLMLCDDIGMGRVQRQDLLGDVLIEPLCPESPKQPISASASRPFGRASAVTTPTVGVSRSSSSSDRVTGASMGTGAVTVTGTAVKERKGTCVAYTPISVCSRNVVSCFRGEEGEEDSSEPAVQVPWIAHVLMGSGVNPDTYLDINLIQ